MTIADIQAKSENWNVRVIGHHDLNGHGDGMQLLKQGRYVYVAHLGTSPMALSILDVADPTRSARGDADAARAQHARAQSADRWRYFDSKSGASLLR